MNFAKCRKSIITGRGRFAVLWAVIGVCLSGGMAHAQVSGLAAPQKQTVTFTFGLGSVELNERYGQNGTSMTKFAELVRQVGETPTAHIDSVVIIAYSSSADQLGGEELAQRRVDAVKAYLEPVIRTSQLRQAVVLTGKVIARNNVFMPDQMFDMLKKVNVTIYMNGLLVAKAGSGQRGAGSAAEEEQRYVSPFGNESDVFGRKAKKAAPQTEQIMPASRIEPIQPIQSVQPVQSGQPAQQMKPIQAVQPVQQPAQQVQPIQPVQPVQPAIVTTEEGDNMLDSDLQRFIDSMTMSSQFKELPDISAVVAGEVTTMKEPEVSAQAITTEKDPCPQDRDPEIEALIRRLLEEQETTGTVLELPVLPETTKTEARKVEIEEVGSVTAGHVSDSKRSAVVEFEITGDPELVSEVADAKKIKAKPVKETKVKPVKPVKVPREPLVLVRPVVAVKTNLAYWAAVAANLEAEFYFAKRWSATVEGVYTSWDMNLYKKHYAVNEISPEVRYWTGRKSGQYRGFYIGVYGHVGQFDYMFANQTTGNTGDYYGGGISLGAYLPFTRHFGMELGLRGGFVHADYDRYYYEAPHYMYRNSKVTNYFGPTGAKVSLVYRFGLGRQ